MEFEDLGIRTKPGRTRYATTCPKCSESRKKTKQTCLTVNNSPGNRWFNCNHCGWSGNLDLLDKYDKVREKSRMPDDPARLKAYSQSFTKYLKSRGFSIKTLLKEQIYEIPGRGGQIVIGFPFFIGKTLVNVKFYKLGAKKDKWFQLPRSLGTKVCFWGFGDHTFELSEDKKETNKVIISEGEWDRLTWKEYGYKNVLSVPQGAPSATAKNFKKEFEYANESYFTELSKLVDIFYLAVDADEPGDVLKEQLAIILGKEKCRIIRYPQGYKDINEVSKGNKEKNLEALGKEGVDSCFNNSTSYPLKGIIKTSQVSRELSRIRDIGFVPGIGIGVPELDYMFTIKRKHISFWTGVPSGGKSVFLRWYIVELIRHNYSMGLKFALFTPENRPIEREYAKIAQVITGQNIQKGQYNSMNDETYRKTMNFIERHFTVISPDRWNYESFDGEIKMQQVNTLNSILNYVKYLVKTEGIFGYIIDAWNKVDHEQPKYITETNYISSQLDMLIDFNTYYNVHSFIVAHPTKLSKNKLGNYEMPSLYDIKGTSAWNEKADLGIVIHRNRFRAIYEKEKRGDDDDRDYVVRHNAPLIIKSEKIRFEELGNTDILRMVMNKSGGFDVFEDDKDMHKRKKGAEKITPEKKTQPELPYKDDDFDEEDEVPF